MACEHMVNCFIASAFDRDDVNAIYDRAVRPVLRELGLRPSRVDRVEHNDDIDDRIFRLIDQCQFCIADLTYARPSVYYEAGYAFGCGKPVVYIARSDHFRVREDDKPGNLRVHFDLQMKNIIPWTEANEAFRNRLRSRLKYVLKSIQCEQKAGDAQRQHEKAFAALSRNEQLNALRSKAQSLLRARGYSRGSFPEDRPSGRDPYHAHLEKTRQKTYRQIHLFIRPAVNKAGLQIVPFLWVPMITKEQYEAVKRIESACIIISLRPVQAASLSNLFPSWAPLDSKTFRRDDLGSLRKEIPHSATIAIMDNIRSVESFSERLRELLERLKSRQSP